MDKDFIEIVQAAYYSDQWAKQKEKEKEIAQDWVLERAMWMVAGAAAAIGTIALLIMVNVWLG